MRLLTQNQATELDKLSTSDYNISDGSLMDMAGKKTADFIHSKFKEIGTQTIAIVCGKGNNGGDGFATALHLDQFNYNVNIFSLFGLKSFRSIFLTPSANNFAIPLNTSFSRVISNTSSLLGVNKNTLGNNSFIELFSIFSSKSFPPAVGYITGSRIIFFVSLFFNSL